VLQGNVTETGTKGLLKKEINMVSKRKLTNILVTGGAGFIGSNFIRYIFENTEFAGKIVNMDCLTYAGNPDNLSDIESKFESERYFFENVNICDHEKVNKIIRKYDIDTVVHFAAESHVDRSILGPGEFIQTNIVGTQVLLDACRNSWENRDDTIFHHISTDEVYGSLGEEGYFYENTPYDPRSPYSASKASSDHIVRAYSHTYGLPITISNCSNNYGPYQFPEKLIPVMILNILEKKPLPVYGDGKNIRDWLYVDDHNSAVWSIINKGKNGETYNIGGENEWENIKLVETLCSIMDKKLPQENEIYQSLITFVKDRPGHDRRYAINCDKIKNDLGWSQSYNFDQGLEKTVDWYLNNQKWVESIRTGDYKKWIEQNYIKR
jgi:dTDP-glucose 4,6-dehydratase